MKTRDEIFAIAKEWAISFDLSFDAEYDAECGFIAGYLACQQNLQQHDVSGRSEQLPLSESFAVWCKETKRNGGVIIGSSIREFFSWYEAKTLEMISGNCH